MFLSTESVSQTFWVVSKCTYVLKILTCEHFCWIIQNDSRPFSVLYIVTHFKCSLLMNINVDMKLSHISSSALSYVVWYHLQNFICILKFGCECGMNFHENAISLVADNLRWQMFRKPNLEKCFVVKRSLPRSGAYGLEMFCLFADWKDGELLIEILFISDFTILVIYFWLY